MTTSTIAVVFFTVIIMMAAVVAIMTVIYATRLPSSKASKNTEQQNEPPAIKSTQNKTDLQFTEIDKLSKSDTPNSILPINEAFDSTELHSSNTLLVAREDKSVRKKQSSANKKKKFNTLPKIHKENQIQIEQTPPIINSKAREPRLDNIVISKVSEIPEIPEIPDPPSLMSEPVPEKQTQAPVPDNPIVEEAISSVPNKTNAEVSIKETDVIMEGKPNNETGKTVADSSSSNREKVASKITGPDNSGSGVHQAQKSEMGDLSDLFAKSSSEDKKANKLAEEMNDIDANDLLRDSLSLISKIKKK